MSRTEDLRIANKEIAAGAWTTESGEPIVAIEETDEGDCAYCGDVIYGIIHVARSGMRLSGKALVLRWFGKAFEPWHIECYQQWVVPWVQASDGATIHRAGCRYASKADDARKFDLTRGEARVILDAPFCKLCAPIEFWLGADELVVDCEQCRGTGIVARSRSAQ